MGKGAAPREAQTLEVLLLGEVELRFGGRTLELPASKKTRALLAHLTAVRSAMRRQQLCDLLWEGPDDPRAALRWSLAKLRALLNVDGIERLQTDREHVRFAARGARVDADDVERLLSSGVAVSSTESLKLALDLWRGDFADGLELPGCYRFHEWCTTERERWNALRVGALTELVQRLRDNPGEALVYARQWVHVSPYAEAGHAAIVRLQGALGRKREALAHYKSARRLLEHDLQGSYFAELERARLALEKRGDSSGITQLSPQATAASRSTERDPPLTGRDSELQRIRRLVADADDGSAANLLLLTGEPGIGKSRLLEETATLIKARGGLRVSARCHEPERMRPYGVWIDALRGAAVDEIPPEMRLRREPLMNQGQALEVAPEDGTRWFDTIVQALRTRATKGPLLVAIDDLQWADETSCALLHYALRELAGKSRVLFLAAARTGEISDNCSALRLLRALQNDRRIIELRLQRLDANATSTLAQSVSPLADAARIFDLSEGNPLLVLQFARAADDGEAAATLDALVAAQLERLGDDSRDLLAWAAACGRRVPVELLRAISGFGVHQTIAALTELEARGLLRPIGADEYDFDHELVRQAVYRFLSAPRRRLMHGKIAQALADRLRGGEAPAGELSHHAVLAGDDLLAARGFATAGERCLRLLAFDEARALAERGLCHLERTDAGAARTALFISLQKVCIQSASGPGLRPLPRVAAPLAQAVADAQRFGLSKEAATAHYLLSMLHERSGNSAQARQSTLAAEAASRAADRADRLRQLANTAHCLVALEADIPRCRKLLGEAHRLATLLAWSGAELDLALGLLERWDGALDSAASSIDKAVQRARGDENHLIEFRALTAQAVVEYERGRFDSARGCCESLVAAAVKLGEPNAPFANCVVALCARAQRRSGANAELESALDALRAADDKAHLGYVLNQAALLAIGSEDRARIESLAHEAEAAALATCRRTDAAIALGLLAACDARRDPNAARKRWDEVLRMVADCNAVAARGRVTIGAIARSAEFQTLDQADGPEDGVLTVDEGGHRDARYR